MDGYVFMAFFFPLLVLFNFLLLIGVFFMSLWVGFGEDFASYLEKEFVHLPLWSFYWLKDAPFSSYTWFYPVVFNLCTGFAVISTYSLGYGFHSKSGWKWFQPGQGGILFVAFQAQTWFTYSLCLVLPWLCVDEIGMLQMYTTVSPASEDRHSHGGLLVMSSISGLVSLLFALCGLISYDAKAKKIHRITLLEDLVGSAQEIERANLDFTLLFGNNESFWWMFVALQICLMFYSSALALLVDYDFLNNSYIQTLALLIYMGFLTTTVSITNSFGGKWRHGSKSYRSWMPFQGGMPYVLLQGVSWVSFALAVIFTWWKIYNVTTITSQSTGGLMRLAGFLGLLSEVLLVLSLVFFDPSKVNNAVQEEPESNKKTLEERESRATRSKYPLRSRARSKSAPRTKKKGEHLVVDRIIGKRPSPKTQGRIEYLVQWRAPYGIRWEDQPALLAKTSSNQSFVLQLIKAYETQLADMVGESILKDKGLRAPMQQTRKKVQRRRARSKSPMRRDATSDSDTSVVSDSDSQDNAVGEVWEECEDEEGNIFYFSVTTGASMAELPHGYNYTST